jgi:Secretion system C-terminal sorting domain
MKVSIILINFISFITVSAQTITDDFLVNNVNQNTNGLGRTSIAAHTNGNFALAWQDYNDYNIPITEQPRIAVQIFNSTITPIGPTNLFQGENRSLSIWTSDYLDANSDIAFTPNGILLVAIEHEGRFSIGADDIGSSEVGIGAVSSLGEVIDLSNENGVISWLISTETKWLEHPRISVGHDGSFLLIADGATYNTNNRAVLIQSFDSEGKLVGDLFTPHVNDLGPQVNYRDPDVATNGNVAMVTWQDWNNDTDWDISAQFYGKSGAIGNNVKVNNGDPQGTINVLPSVVMNSSGQSVIIWLDTRENPDGEVYAQKFSDAGLMIGENIKVSYNSGTIMDRPEIAILDDGSFMVVWVDNQTKSTDISGYRALGRQFKSDGTPIGEKFILPNIDVPSVFANIGSNGLDFYCSWLDDRLNTQYLNVYAKMIKLIPTSVENKINKSPENFILMQNYPNPFNPTTNIKYWLPEQSKVRLIIYNSLGEYIVTLIDEVQYTGYHNLIWDGSKFSTGIYILRIFANPLYNDGDFMDFQKMLLIK